MRDILPGRPQSSRQALSTVNWDGLRVVAYLSDNTVLIFNGRRELLQSIAIDESSSLCALAIEEQSGYIAVSDENTVYIYHPLGRDYGDLRWARLQILNLKDENAISVLSWSSRQELLVGGSHLTVWSLADEDSPQAIWTSRSSSPVAIAAFSPDSGIIVSCGAYDRVVKVWRRLSYEQDSTRFDVSYLMHPAAVTNLVWRHSWHQEQNLDNVLYTFCEDNHIRVWSHAEHHAYSTMQKAATLDGNAAIQPRRMSMSSISQSRFAFVIENRDLARATERTVQIARQGTDHALEHLVEIANRTPEVCVVLDGLGHMSAWGLENLGLRNKLQPEKFNIALLDGVDVALPLQKDKGNYAQIYAFANNDASASLCLLVHMYDGQIDWYQGTFLEFFDTAPRTKRLRLMSCWSGHDSPVTHMAASPQGHHFISITEQNNAILWSRSATGALIKASEIVLPCDPLDVALVSDGRFAVFLEPNKCSLWDLRSQRAKVVSSLNLGRDEATSFRQIFNRNEQQNHYRILLSFESNNTQELLVRLPLGERASQSQGNDASLSLNSDYAYGRITNRECTELCTYLSSADGHQQASLFSWSDRGQLKVWPSRPSKRQPLLAEMQLSIRPSILASLVNGKSLAIVHVGDKTISIWNVSQAACEAIYSFVEFGEIEALQWHNLRSASPLLAVQFAHHVVVLKSRSRTHGCEQHRWSMVRTINTRKRSDHPIGSICWLYPADLVVSLGNQIFTFDITKAESESAYTNGVTSNTQEQDSLFALTMQNTADTAFDPSILGPLIRAGHYNTTLAILELVNKELKFLIKGDHLTLDAISVSEASTHSASTTTTLNGTRILPSFDLDAVQSQMSDRIDDIPDWQLSPASKSKFKSLLSTTTLLLENLKSFDEQALTYAYHFLTALSTADPSQTSPLPTLPYSAIVFATLSETQEALIHFILAQLDTHTPPIKLTWPVFRALGLSLFTTDLDLLKTHFEAVARAEYNRTPDDRNPVDCSLYYLALDKKPILQSLWRRTVGIKEKDMTLKLLANNFADPRWKATALKNAYALLSKRRFEYAAAFFLLGGSLADAVNVCVERLRDVQLGIAVARVWSGDEKQREEVMQNVLQKTVLNLAVDSVEARWMAIWTCVYKQDLARALEYVVEQADMLFEDQISARKEGESEEQKKKNVPFEAQNFEANEPTLLLKLYDYIRTRMLERRQWTLSLITPAEEWAFVMRSVNWYVRTGQDWLALHLVATWKFVDWQDEKVVESSKHSAAKGVAANNAAPKSMLDAWLEPENEVGAQVAKVKSNDGETSNKTESKAKAKPPPTQFVEPTADSLLDSFGF